MKEFKCYDCEGVFKAENREEILDTLYDHYMKEHHEIIAVDNLRDTVVKRWVLTGYYVALAVVLISIMVYQVQYLPVPA